MSILEKDVKALLDSQVVTLEQVIFYCAKALNSGKDSDEKISLFREGKVKTGEKPSVSHDPDLENLGWSVSKSKLKLSGLHKLTACIDCRLVNLDAHIEQVEAFGYTFESLKNSEVNPGMKTLFVFKTFE